MNLINKNVYIMGQWVIGKFFNRGNPAPDFRMTPSISGAPEPKTHRNSLARQNCVLVFCCHLQQTWRGDGSNRRSPSGVNDHKSWRPRLHNDTHWSEFLLMDVLGHFKETWVPKNWCFWTVVLEKTLESPLDSKEIVLNIHWKDWCWSWNSDTLATWWEELTHWERPWHWERLRAGGEEDTSEDEKVGWHHRLNRHEITKSRR